jgi:hypothetical protein
MIADGILDALFFVSILSFMGIAMTPSEQTAVDSTEGADSSDTSSGSDTLGTESTADTGGGDVGFDGGGFDF